ncbi:hypothetical protein GQ600_25348 [Phytophthora cactorum]|nr:hypothetical protein GQ600_25348 [Phytophthora cactorum]
MRRASCSQTETRTQISQCTQCCNPTTYTLTQLASGARSKRRCSGCTCKPTPCSMLLPPTILFRSTLTFDWTRLLGLHRGDDDNPDELYTGSTVKLLGPKCQGQVPIDLYGPRCVPVNCALDGFGSTRKSDDGNQRLICGLPYLLTGVGSLFPWCTWLRSPAPSDPVNESVIRSHYSVAPKNCGLHCDRWRHIDSVRDRALRAMGKQTKSGTCTYTPKWFKEGLRRVRKHYGVEADHVGVVKHVGAEDSHKITAISVPLLADTWS